MSFALCSKFKVTHHTLLLSAVNILLCFSFLFRFLGNGFKVQSPPLIVPLRLLLWTIFGTAVSVLSNCVPFPRLARDELDYRFVNFVLKRAVLSVIFARELAK